MSWVRLPLSAPSPLTQHSASPTALWRNWQTRGIQNAVSHGREGSIPSGATTSIQRALHALLPRSSSGRGRLPPHGEEREFNSRWGTNHGAPCAEHTTQHRLLPPSSRGPGRRPFKARTRVRISLGNHRGARTSTMHARVAEWQTRQLEGLVFARTCGFESRFAHHENDEHAAVPAPVRATAVLAREVARGGPTRRAGSNPSLSPQAGNSDGLSGCHRTLERP